MLRRCERPSASMCVCVCVFVITMNGGKASLFSALIPAANLDK